MKILDIDINWYKNASNIPKMVVTVDELEKPKKYSSKIVNEYCTLYYGENKYFMNFLYHNSMDENGFGGRVFEIEVDGIRRKIKGPWFTNSTAIKRMTNIDVMEVEAICNKKNMSANMFMRVQRAEALVSLYLNMNILKVTHKQDVYYTFTKVPFILSDSRLEII